MSQDSTHTIIKSARRFFGGTMLSRLTGMFRDISMAFVFGTQESIAAFLVAFRLAHLLRRLFGEGALQTAFIPQFETLRAADSNRACRFFRDLFVLLTLGLIAIVFVALILLGGCLAFFSLSDGNREIVTLTLLLMPSLLFICLFGLSSALLQCEKSYFISGVAPVAFNVIWALGVLSLWQIPSGSAMPWLSLWVIVACLCQWLMTVPRTLAILRSHGLATIWKGVQIFSPDIKTLAKPLFLGILGVAASQVNNALDAVFARYADLEGPALLWYALRIQQLPLALFGIAIAGALLPPLTRALKSKDLVTYQYFLEFALRRSVALMLPITVALFVLGDSCIQLIYGRGDFSAESTVGTSQCLWGYSAGLIPMTLVLILAPAFYSQSNYRVPAAASIFSMILNVTLNALFIMKFGYGSASVAWATAISSWANFFFLAWALPYKGILGSRNLILSALKVTAASFFGGITVILVDSWLFQGNTSVQIWQGLVPAFPKSFMDQVVRLSIQGFGFLSVLAFMAWILGAKDLLNLAGRDTPTVAEKLQ